VIARAQELRTRGRRLDVSRPLVMGILNATPDSFSDGGRHPDVESRVERGLTLIDQGADLLDVGGESLVTTTAPVSPEEEIERVVPLIERVVSRTAGLARETGVLISVDTYKPAVARAAIEAGATIVNDPSGLMNPEVAGICAETGAALVITHTRARPKQKLHKPHYADVVEDVKRFLAEKLDEAGALGMSEEQVVLCPGPDLGKDPAQTVELLRHLDELTAFGRPLLLAVSRKDFVGALTSRRPRERLAGTLAAIAHGLPRGGRILRVHDVAAVRDFLAVRAALEGEAEIAPDLLLPDELRWEERAGTAAKEDAR
jgi:dihydropteroate synthase